MEVRGGEVGLEGGEGGEGVRGDGVEDTGQVRVGGGVEGCFVGEVGEEEEGVLVWGVHCLFVGFGSEC